MLSLVERTTGYLAPGKLEARTTAEVNGTNESTNGLLRQYLPRRCDMADLTQDDCTAIAAKLNDRARKRLGDKTPAESLTPR